MEQAQLSQKIQFVLCPGRSPSREFAPLYQHIYQCWHQLWSKTYSELNNDQNLTSDTFTRQDIIGAILVNGICQAFILFRHLDLSLNSSKNDSYLEHWCDLHLNQVTHFGQNVLICGNLGIMPSARKDSLGFSMKDLMMGFITEIAINSKADIVISTPRKDKNVHGAVYKWGGMVIAEDVDWGLGVVVDLTAFVKQNLIINRNQPIMPLVHRLWSEKLVIPETRIETVNSFLNDSIKTISEKKAA